MLTKTEATQLLNQLGAERTPFYFFCDFLAEKWFIQLVNEPNKEVQFSFGENPSLTTENIQFLKYPISFEEYQEAFEKVKSEIFFGNSYLANLTFPTSIETNLTLLEIFQLAKAKYKVFVKDQFVCFSPESFVKISKNEISSFPMKGTINASIENAEEIILADEKEQAEHATIVDLIRNDISQIAKKVHVPRFRYIDRIKTHEGEILQVSSEIKGSLQNNWQSKLGDILNKLLPAGSISGAPKKKTIEIILEAEPYQRDFYTGICGYFDGESLDTGVMIRFIKQQKNKLFFHSGGGITYKSDAQKEYQELIEKVYLPFS